MDIGDEAAIANSITALDTYPSGPRFAKSGIDLGLHRFQQYSLVMSDVLFLISHSLVVYNEIVDAPYQLRMPDTSGKDRILIINGRLLDGRWAESRTLRKSS